MIPKIILILILSISITKAEAKATGKLKREIENLISTKQADIGVSICGIENGETLNIKGNVHFPLQSIFKFHIALAILNEVDNKKTTLSHKLTIKKEQLKQETWSPMRDDYPSEDIEISLSEVLSYTVSKSDNIGCDALLDFIGGATKVDSYIRSVGESNFAIVYNEEEMQQEWSRQFSNWTTPKSATRLLTKFQTNNLLNPTTNSLLLEMMLNRKTGSNRIKKGLPEGTQIAHKTGTSGRNREGIMAAINDIGIVTTPSGDHYSIAIFITNSKESYKNNEKIIADISALVWNHFKEL